MLKNLCMRIEWTYENERQVNISCSAVNRYNGALTFPAGLLRLGSIEWSTRSFGTYSSSETVCCPNTLNTSTALAQPLVALKSRRRYKPAH